MQELREYNKYVRMLFSANTQSKKANVISCLEKSRDKKCKELLGLCYMRNDFGVEKNIAKAVSLLGIRDDSELFCYKAFSDNNSRKQRNYLKNSIKLGNNLAMLIYMSLTASFPSFNDEDDDISDDSRDDQDEDDDDQDEDDQDEDEEEDDQDDEEQESVEKKSPVKKLPLEKLQTDDDDDDEDEEDEEDEDEDEDEDHEKEDEKSIEHRFEEAIHLYHGINGRCMRVKSIKLFKENWIEHKHIKSGYYYASSLEKESSRQAIKIHKEIHEMEQSLSTKDRIGHSAYNLGHIYLKSNKKKEAMKYFEYCHSIGHTEGSYMYAWFNDDTQLMEKCLKRIEKRTDLDMKFRSPLNHKLIRIKN
jgi:hypothetical protein